MQKEEWILCSVCGNKTRVKIREDTVLANFPLYCPKCKPESLVDAENFVLPAHGKRELNAA